MMKSTELSAVSPHADHLHDFHLLEHLVNQPVLYVDTSGVRLLQIAYKFLEGRVILERVFPQNLQ